MSCQYFYALRSDGDGCAFSWAQSALALSGVIGALALVRKAVGAGEARQHRAHLQYVQVSQHEGTELILASPFPSGTWRGYYTQRTLLPAREGPAAPPGRVRRAWQTDGSTRCASSRCASSRTAA